MAQAFYSPDVVQAGQVPSTQTNFPRLFLPTDNRFRTIANGGHVANANGYDIRPYSDAALTTALTFELVPGTYNATTGFFEMWILVASLADGNTIYFGYGDASLTTDGSTSPWDANYKGVWHLAEATGSNNLDSTSSGFTLTPANSPVQGAGKVGGSLTFNGSTQQAVQASAATVVNPSSTDITIESWLNVASFAPPDVNARVIGQTIDGSNAYWVALDDSGSAVNTFNLLVRKAGTDYQYYVTTGKSTSTWYHYVATFDKTSNVILIYINGSSVPLTSDGGFGYGNADNKLYIGERSDGSGHYNGRADEVRISNTKRAANWITTEFNNQSAPGTFSVLGTEVAVGASFFAQFNKQSRQAVNRASFY